MVQQKTCLGDAAEIVAGFAFPSSGYQKNPSDCRLLRGITVGPQRLDWSDPLFWKRSNDDGLEKYELADGDIVVAMDRPWIAEGFRVTQLTRDDLPALLVQRVARLRARPGFHARFLYHMMCSGELLRHLKTRHTETTVPHISHKDLAAFSFHTPPFPEQRRIADILDKADAIRRQRKEAVALTEELLRSAFLEMFGDPVTNPKGWKEWPLGELADAASGVTKGKRYNGQELVTLPYMRVANVQDGHLVLDEVKTITVSKEDGCRYRLEYGDVLLTEGGDPDKLGRGAVWRAEVPDCIHQNHIFRVRAGSKLRAEYLSALIGSERGKRYFLRAAKQTTGIATINMTQLKAFPALVPPLPLQDRYVTFVSKLAATRSQLQDNLVLTDALFGSLAARAFSGGLTS